MEMTNCAKDVVKKIMCDDEEKKNIKINTNNRKWKKEWKKMQMTKKGDDGW